MMMLFYPMFQFPVPRRDHNCDVIWHAISFSDQADIFSGQVNKFPGKACYVPLISSIIGGSCHKYHFCWDKSSVAANTCFVLLLL